MYPIIEEEWIQLPDNSFIKVVDFEDKFGTVAQHQFRYEYLFNHENSTEAWKNIFDAWKTEGVLN